MEDMINATFDDRHEKVLLGLHVESGSHFSE
jgi:hypothetical protein